MQEYCCPKESVAQALPFSPEAQHPPQLTFFRLSAWPSKHLRAQIHKSHQSQAVKCPLQPQGVPQRGPYYWACSFRKEPEENPQHGCSQLAPSRSLHKKCHFPPLQMLRVPPLHPAREKDMEPLWLCERQGQAQPQGTEELR